MKWNLALSSLPLIFLAFTASASDSRQVGHSTQQWLDLQKSGVEAPRDHRPLRGPVAKRSYDRYLKSFEREIPQSLLREGEGD